MSNTKRKHSNPTTTTKVADYVTNDMDVKIADNHKGLRRENDGFKEMCDFSYKLNHRPGGVVSE